MRRRRHFGFTLIELMIVVAVLSILAVVAVPAFVKFMRRARTTEAIDELTRIYRGAAHYYTAAHIFAYGAPVPCQFPGPTGITPTQKSCCLDEVDTDADGRCNPDGSWWSASDGVWQALSFQMTDQHYFSYGFDSAGTLTSAVFTASAYADLDCDGNYSTFQRLGFGDPQATRAECSMRGSAAFYVENETE